MIPIVFNPSRDLWLNGHHTTSIWCRFILIFWRLPSTDVLKVRNTLTSEEFIKCRRLGWLIFVRWKLRSSQRVIVRIAIKSINVSTSLFCKLTEIVICYPSFILFVQILEYSIYCLNLIFNSKIIQSFLKFTKTYRIVIIFIKVSVCSTNIFEPFF